MRTLALLLLLLVVYATPSASQACPLALRFAMGGMGQAVMTLSMLRVMTA